jgi:hypothetical protein
LYHLTKQKSRVLWLLAAAALPGYPRSVPEAIALPRRPPDAEEVVSTIPFEHFPVWTRDGSLCPIDIVYMKIDGPRTDRAVLPAHGVFTAMF